MRRLTFVLLLLAACNRPEQQRPAEPPPIGNAGRGKVLIAQHGCNVCHIIPGVEGPQGSLGPSLEGVASRAAISNNVVQNTPQNLVQYIQQPASLNPESTMPPLGITPQDAHDIAAYLLTLN